MSSDVAFVGAGSAVNVKVAVPPSSMRAGLAATVISGLSAVAAARADGSALRPLLDDAGADGPIVTATVFALPTS